MTPEESLALLAARWSRVEALVEGYGEDPSACLTRDCLVIRARIESREREVPGAPSTRDLYVFRLDFADYDEHAPRIFLCDPTDPTKIGTGRQFYPRIGNNNVFNHDGFLCMQGDRRCYESGHHPEWRQQQYYHPEVVLEFLFQLLRSEHYQGPL